MSGKTEYQYDVFISYSSIDKEWVRGWLLPELEKAGLHVCIDFIDFEAGAPVVNEIEKAILRSRKTLLILTPAYLGSKWAEFENLMLQTLAHAGDERRLIPILKAPCDLPLRISYLNYVDFVEPDSQNFAWQKLMTALGRVNATPPGPVYPFPPGCSGRIGKWVFEVQRLPVATRTIMLVLLLTVATVLGITVGLSLLPTFTSITCSRPIQDSGILIKPVKDSQIVSDLKITGVSVLGAQGMLQSQGSIELSGLPASQTYSLTLNGKLGRPPNDQLRQINSTWKGEGYWDFISVTTDTTGKVNNQYLLATLPPHVTLCLGRNYRAKFFVKDTANRPILGTDDFLFVVEPSDSIPQKLTITISNATSVKDVTDLGQIELTNASIWPDVIPVKGDSPVTVNVQAFNVSGAEIPAEKLDYHWQLCCGDQQNKTPVDTQLSTWKFEPPTNIRYQTLTITVSNENGYGISAKIQFKLKDP